MTSWPSGIALVMPASPPVSLHLARIPRRVFAKLREDDHQIDGRPQAPSPGNYHTLSFAIEISLTLGGISRGQ